MTTNVFLFNFSLFFLYKKKKYFFDNRVRVLDNGTTTGVLSFLENPISIQGHQTEIFSNTS
jgi:hypothetical protein